MPALPPAQSRFNPRAKIAMLSALFLLACALIFAFVLIAPAKGDVTAVGFNTPAFETCGNLKVSSTRTLTYGNGKLIAGETSDSAVTADVANSKSNSTITTWISTKYGTDAIKDVLSNASLPNAETVDSCSGMMPQSDDSYWLSDTSDYCGFSLQGIRLKTNAHAPAPLLYSPSTPETSSTDSQEVNIFAVTPDKTKFVQSYALSTMLEGFDYITTNYSASFTWPGDSKSSYHIIAPYVVSLTLETKTNSEIYNSSFTTHTVANCENWVSSSTKYYQQVRSEGQEVWNNPFCIEDHSKGYYKTTYKSLSRQVTGAETDYTQGSAATLKSTYYSQVKLVENVNFPFYRILNDGYEVSTGDILFSCDIKAEELTDSTGFETSNGYCKNYFKAQTSGYAFATGSSAPEYQIAYSPIGGFTTGVGAFATLGYTKAGTHAIRPMFDITSSKIAFFRDATSNKTLTTSSTLDTMPKSTLRATDTSKAVIKQQDVTINISSPSNSNFTSDLDANRTKITTYSSDTVGVPYKSSKLTVSGITTSNASYISAVAKDSSGAKRYSVLSTAEDGSANSVTIDLSNILDTYSVGDEATISLYAENPSAENTSDEISNTPYSFKVKVIEGRKSKVIYNNGGGTGTVPDTIEKGAGGTLTLASGTNLYTTSGDMFAGWKVTYNPYGGGDAVEETFKAGEQILMPDTADGEVQATAIYAGMSTSKTTTTSSTVCSCTWYLNAPTGASCTLNGSSVTKVNTKVSGSASSYTITSTPTVSPTSVTTSSGTYTFAGWAKSSDATTALTFPQTVSTHTTFYAVWKKSSLKVKWYNGSKLLQTNEVDKGATVSRNTTAEASVENKTFAGWYTDSSLTTKATSFWNKESVTVNSDVTDYGKWIDNKNLNESCWMKTKGDFGTKTTSDSSTQLTPKTTQKEINILRAGEGNNDYATTLTKWTNFMNNDVHLYTTYGSNQTIKDGYAEFRIISLPSHLRYYTPSERPSGYTEPDGVGDCNDESTITFMAVHALPKAYRMNGSDDNAGGWPGCELRKVMNSGEIYKNFNSSFTGAITAVTKNCSAGSVAVGGGTKKPIETITDVSLSSKDKFWLASSSELGGYVYEKGGNTYVNWYEGNPAYEGPQYTYWYNKAVKVSSTSNAALNGLSKTHAGSSPSDMYSGLDYWWLRSPVPLYSAKYVDSSADGMLWLALEATKKIAVVPCFAF